MTIFQDIARLKFRGDTKQYAAAAKQIERQNKLITASVRTLKAGVAGLAAGLGTLRLGQLVTGFIDVISASERLKGALVTVTGSQAAAGAEFERLLDFAARTPFTLDQSISAFIRLKSLGIEPTEARLQAFGNTAAAFGTDMTDFIEAVADASTFEFERLKTFGIKAKQQGNQVALTFQGTTTIVRKSSEDIIRFLEDIGRVNFGGAMEEQMKRLPGLVSNLDDNFQKLWIQVGESGGKDAAIATLTEMNSLLDDINAILKVNEEDTKSWLQKTQDMVVNAVKTVFPGLISSIEQVRAAVRKAGEDARDEIALSRREAAFFGDDITTSPGGSTKPAKGGGVDPSDPFGKKKISVAEDFRQAFDPQSDRAVEEQRNRQALFREIRQEHLDQIFESETEFQELMRNLQTTAAKDTLRDLKSEFDQGKQLREAQVQFQIQTFSKLTTTLAGLANSRNKTLSTIGKAAALAAVGIDTAQAIISHRKEAAKFPFPASEGIFAALVATTILEKGIAIAQITKSAGALQQGGLIPGNPSLGDAFAAVVHAGEVAVPRKNFEELKRGIELNALERAGGAGTGRGGEQEVRIEIELKRDASELIVAQRAEDRALGLE